ncbi:restriction endonuclease subunit S [Vibrio ezurae]|uniref:Type I restriction modification DNA specificity domain-containing protein n=1 Tax=Vibrio ezurae NBRC 102218 TaxID=1219080 RepID=U3B0K3_9VIBR|nr:restriction endonuclease subunit S [Vibrio ezurae]GAD79012.1 hypothetical protein VEZ01S_08_00480 [Vibrio ezurae NBRC 102218]
MTEQLNVPKLRFFDFDDALELKYFGELVNDITYGPRFSAEDYCSDGNVRTIRGTDMGVNGEIKYHQVPTANLDEKTVDRHKLKDGDLVMITTADCGVTSVYREQSIKHICSAYAVKINLNENADSTYLKYFYQTTKAQYEVSRFIRKATVSNLPGSDINRIRHYPPLLPEQQKIASFLSKVDEKISLLSEKKDKLTEYKKGVMQQLFNGKWGYVDGKEDGQLTFIPPTLRFKADDGSEFPDWEEKCLGEIVSIKSPKVVPFEGIELPCIELDNLSQETGRIIGDLSVNGALSQKNRFKAGDVLFGKLRPYLKKFAYPDFAGMCSSEIWVMSSADSLSSNYLFQFIQTEDFVAEANKSSGTKMPRADWKVVSQMKFGLPCLGEQTRIANFLSAIDQKIDLANTELEKAKEWKKGLLQQMFV